jgi:hypothetical protein
MSSYDYRWDNWTGDFSESFASRSLDASVRDQAGAILSHFGEAVQAIDPDFPDDVSSGTFAKVLTESMPRLVLDDEIRVHIPEVIATFFEYLGDDGRLGQGADWAAQIRIIAKSYRERLRPGGGVKGMTIRKPTGTSPLGRNDPCPCGSGKKYKKCCMIA